MEPDIKDVIGVLMRILGGGDVSQVELDDLGFDADGELQTVMNEVYIKLREFAHDRPLRAKDRELATIPTAASRRSIPMPIMRKLG